jgi:predicted DNA-binding WGR domain protein
MPAKTKLDVPVTAWYLTNTTANHYKDYTVYLADNGVLAIHWGKIDTAGQSKIEKHASYLDAKAVALRQVYAKASRGYVLKVDELKFVVDESVLIAAATTKDHRTLHNHFVRAREQHSFEGDKVAVFGHYDGLIEKASALMNRAASAESFDSLMDEFNAMEVSWTAIEDKRNEAETTISLTRQMLMQKLMSG